MNQINTRKSLNPAYRKFKPKRSDVNNFISELDSCLKIIREAEESKKIGEDFMKSPLINFLKNTFYKNNFINSKDKIDLAIYSDEKVSSDVKVIIELKQPDNKQEYLSDKSLNKKALHELLLYYLTERIDKNNNNIKHLIATNGYTWYFFKSEDFHNMFYKNKGLIKEYNDFKLGYKDSSKNELFYKEIASKYISEVENEIPFVFIDFTKSDINRYSDSDLNTLYKIFSDVNILGVPFGNDNNELNKDFYQELLHIIGLEERKEKGKKIIDRKKESDRDYGSLLENTIFTLEDKDYLRFVKRFKEKKSFNAGLSLCLTWVNRILFLKLLESQLKTYHKDSKNYSFLNSDFIKGFDDLNDLFFSALAKKQDERHPKFKDKYKYIPYLNSSLFERNDLESSTFDISSLNDDEIEIYKGSILKNEKGKKLEGKIPTLEYLFKFLDSYDFATDTSESITDEESKTLISSSVLGKIFEKLNGYKDGSFYTPSNITMYMCRSSLRRSIVQKFKEEENQNIETFNDLNSYCHDFFKHEDRLRLNNVFNSIKICDPAVGSGHFLVSALNELILIKHELGLLIDAKGNRLSDYDIKIVNDELYIIDEKGFFIEYNPNNIESVRVQHTLFHEKKTLIENCLFGVDINPNSVKICRLRLWIELLKNSYYTTEGVLETLPNIDINIKTGNSLISRFKLDDDLTKSFKGIEYNLTDYKKSVKQYKESKSKSEKNKVIEIIREIKNNFTSTFNNRKKSEKERIVGKYEEERIRQENLVNFYNEKITQEEKVYLKSLKKEAESIIKKEEEINQNVLYDNSFEWRFEFPEILNKKGDFIGFDVVIGNPPYGVSITGLERKYLSENLDKVPDYEIYYWFINLGHKILKPNGNISYIIPNSILFNVFAQNYRIQLFDNWNINEILDCTDFDLFSDATVRNIIFEFTKTEKPNNKLGFRNTKNILSFEDLTKVDISITDRSTVESVNQNWGLIFKLDQKVLNLINKIKSNSIELNQLFSETSQGLIAYDKYKGQSEEIIKNRSYHSTKKTKESHKKWINGSDVIRYNVEWNGEEYIDYCDGIANPRDPKFFIGKRILIREITNPRIFASYTSEELYNDPSILIIKDSNKDISIKCLLSILNSKLITFYHFNSSPKATKGAFPKILVYDINKFPLPENPNKDLTKKLDDISEQIIKIKKDDPNKDISNLDLEIDEIIYKLYDLTKNEIDLIESNF